MRQSVPGVSLRTNFWPAVAKLSVVLLVALVGIQIGLAPPAAASIVQAGSEFYAFGLQNAPDFVTGSIQPTYANPNPGPVTVTATSCGTGASTTSIVPAATSVAAPVAIPMADGTSGVTSRPVYHFTSDGPVGVSIANSNDPAAVSNDVSQLLPVSQWGSQYVITSYDAVYGWPTNYPSQIAIVAAQTTVVVVTPSVTTLPIPFPILLPQVPFTFVLQACQGVEIDAMYDLTGTTVTSEFPVGVFEGVSCTDVPRNAYACDHLEEQAWPTNKWGQDYLVCRSPARGTEPDAMRIVALTPGLTTVTVSGAMSATYFLWSALDPLVTVGTQHQIVEPWTEFEVTGDIYISSDRPISVVQYLEGSQRTGTPGNGDPAMVQVPPIASTDRQYAFHTWSGWNGFAAIGLDSVAAPGMTLDGATLPLASFSAVGTTGYVCARPSVGAGLHQVVASGNVAVTYGGYAQDSSYLAPAFAPEPQCPPPPAVPCPPCVIPNNPCCSPPPAPAPWSLTESFESPPMGWTAVRGTGDVAAEDVWVNGSTFGGGWPPTGYYALTAPSAQAQNSGSLLMPFGSGPQWSKNVALDYYYRSSGNGVNGGSHRVLLGTGAQKDLGFTIEFADSFPGGLGSAARVTINGDPLTSGPGTSSAGDGNIHRVWIFYSNGWSVPGCNSAVFSFSGLWVFEDSLDNLVASKTFPTGWRDGTHLLPLGPVITVWGFDGNGPGEHAIDDITMTA